MNPNKLYCQANKTVFNELDTRITALEEGGGGTEYTAGDGIDITNDVISVDSETIYDKTDVDGLLADKQDVEIATGEYAGMTVEEAIDDINSNYESLQSAVAGKEDTYQGWVLSDTDDYEVFVDTNGKFAQDFMVEVKNTLNYVDMSSLVLFRKGMMLSEYGTVSDSKALSIDDNGMTIGKMDITVKQVIVSPHDKLGCEYFRTDGQPVLESDPVSGDMVFTFHSYLSDPLEEPTELTFTSGSLNATKFRIWVKAQE